MFEAIDLSSANGNDPNFVVAKSSGAVAVYLRETDGVRWEDPAFERRAKEVLDAGDDLGAYHFLRVRHGRPQDADAQIRAYHEIAMKAGVTLRPAIDCEPVPNAGDEHNQATGVEWAAAISTAVSECKSCFGCWPLIYTYPGFWASKPELADSFFDVCDLWIADYRGARAPLIPKPWLTWLGWQYASGAKSSQGRVPGVQGLVDVTRFNCDVSDMRLPSI